MPATLTYAIGIPTEQQHSDQAWRKGNRSDPAEALDVSPASKALEHLRKPKPKCVAARVGKEQSRRKHQHRWLPERLPNRNVLHMGFRAPLFGKASRYPIAFLRAKPSHFLGPVGQHEQGHYS